MIDREQIEKVRAACEIAEVVREFVPSLKQSGRSLLGLCPFHNERTPSFHVNAEKGFFKCFGCGEAGDVITFVSKVEQFTFMEALRRLADRAGIPLKETQQRFNKEPEGLREKIFRVLEAAQDYYEDQLWDDRAGEECRNYLASRKINDDTVRRFQLGVCAGSGQSAFEVLVKKGFSIELCQQAGIVTRSTSGRLYDPMHGRLIFPIHDSFGHVIGFGGRVLPSSKRSIWGSNEEAEGKEAPKYLNSPETPVFSKGKSLYGLYQGKSSVLSSRRAIILEGYMDVVGVHQGGVANAVATLGTALTSDHAKILKRYASEVVAFFDPDEAGHKAALRGLEPMLAEDLYPRIVMTVEKGDPDEIISEKGKSFFDDLIEKAPDFVDYFFSKSGVDQHSPLQDKAAAAKRFFEIIAKSPNEIYKAEWLKRAALRLGLNPASLEQEFEKKKGTFPTDLRPKQEPNKRAKEPFLPSAEEEYLELILSTGDKRMIEEAQESDFSEERHKRLLSLIGRQLAAKGTLSLPALYDEISEGDKPWVISLSLNEKNITDAGERSKQLLRDIRIKRGRERLSQLGQILAKGQGNPEVQQEFNDLLRRVKGSARPAV